MYIYGNNMLKGLWFAKLEINLLLTLVEVFIALTKGHDQTTHAFLRMLHTCIFVYLTFKECSVVY